MKTGKCPVCGIGMNKGKGPMNGEKLCGVCKAWFEWVLAKYMHGTKGGYEQWLRCVEIMRGF